MQFRRQQREDITVNLTPLIDVVFLLLIFFMVSTTFTEKTELDIVLPEANGKQRTTPDQKVEVVVGSGGQYSVDGSKLNGDGREALRSVLLRKAKQGTERPFIITADAQARHEAVVQVMDVAGRIGFNQINIATRQPGQKGTN